MLGSFERRPIDPFNTNNNIFHESPDNYSNDCSNYDTTQPIEVKAVLGPYRRYGYIIKWNP
jgi:hypothetical protein